MTERTAVSIPIWHKYPDEKPQRHDLFLCMNNGQPEVLRYYNDREGFASVLYKKKSTVYNFEGVKVSAWTDLNPLLEPLKKDFHEQ